MGVDDIEVVEVGLADVPQFRFLEFDGKGNTLARFFAA